MNYRSYQDLSTAIWRYLHRLPREYDVIVGVPRSGMIAATMLSMYLHTNLASLDGFARGETMPCGRTRTDCRESAFQGIRNALVIDDSVYSGESMQEARRQIEQSQVLQSANIHIDYAAVYCVPGPLKGVDFAFETLPPPRCFQWNIFNHPSQTIKTCFDIDGVVARDPTREENDDGEKYKRFLETAQRIIPIRFRIGAFVSSRLEKYRAQTEAWLRANGFVYKDLILLNLPTKEERIRQNAHAKFKASVYKSRPETLFVESELRQAEEIALLSGKDVFCTENMRLIEGHRHGERR